MSARIAFVKTGWSDAYQGGPVVGRHSHILKFEEAHEKFNFRRVGDSGFYGYPPPIGRSFRPPQPKESTGWLVIFVAARYGTGPLTVVGWYNNATFEIDYEDRPEYQSGNDFETDVDGNHYVYCVKSETGRLIKAADRDTIISGEHFGRTPVVYARGNGRNDEWRRELAAIAENLESSADTVSPRAKALIGFPDEEHRRNVEMASIDSAKKYLRSQKYKITDRQSDNCGYDLLAKRPASPEELHIEVKGTSNEAMHFYMSRNEKMYMTNPKWRLLVVTDALRNPKISLLTQSEAAAKFCFSPIAWEATLKLNNCCPPKS